jgi:hypothetical protein
MTEKDIERCREQAYILGYLRFVGKSNVFYYNKFGNGWTVEVIIHSSNNSDFYIVEAALSGTNTRLTKDFVTGHEDILGPIHQWCKSLIAFHKLMEG